ncbi:MAG: type I-B CRISPR-associated protein Cas8b1/Cst1, partial [Candidatus Methanogasteraceae archaeon]
MADEMIYSVTGNPFVNAGSYAIASWLKKKNLSEIDKYDLEDCIHDIIPIYFSENWKKQMYMIFPNSSIVNPSVKNKEERYT